MGNVGGKIGGKYSEAIQRINWAARYKAALQQILTNIVFILLCGIATLFVLLSNIFRSRTFSIPITTQIKTKLHVNRITLPPNVKETARQLFL
jgi:hypothetical protein